MDKIYKVLIIVFLILILLAHKLGIDLNTKEIDSLKTRLHAEGYLK